KMINFRGSLSYQLLQLVLVTPFLLQQRRLLQSSFNCRFDLPDVEWLHDVIEGPGAQRLNGRLNIVLTANHYDYAVRRNRMDMRHQFQATHATHIYVADNQIKFLPGQNEQGFFG